MTTKGSTSPQLPPSRILNSFSFHHHHHHHHDAPHPTPWFQKCDHHLITMSISPLKIQQASPLNLSLAKPAPASPSLTLSLQHPQSSATQICPCLSLLSALQLLPVAHSPSLPVSPHPSLFADFFETGSHYGAPVVLDRLNSLCRPSGISKTPTCL